MNQFAPPTLPAPVAPVAEQKTRWKPIVVIVAVVSLVAGGAWWQGERQKDDRQEELRDNARRFGG